MSSIPDAAHLLKVRERLWDGRAAVLVGAGFSRSAITVVSGTPRPPLWSDIARALVAELYPTDPHSAPSDPLRLAEEYEKTLSRDALHELIARVVADDAHEPGSNHRELLKLRWSDVLTTNYDTLLERAALATGRRYAIVRSPKGLPQAPVPRIIKLHGSLPDIYPLIITEEDYRRYAQSHGPFVSLARTRLVEHSLVMVGFSGDDPNFLHWSGWVRDHLPCDAPPLYFVTVGLSAPKRTLLERRGIAPIDLAPAFPEADWPDPDERHREALTAFLDELKRGRPSNPLEWPKSHTPSSSPRVPLLPPPTKNNAQVQGHDQSPSDLLHSWREQRTRYPGWTVAPLSVREALWRDTEKWYNVLFRDIPSLKAPNDLLLTREFVWRLNTAFVPILGGDEAQVLLRVLGRYNPIPGAIEVPKAESGDDKEATKQKNYPYTPHNATEWDWSVLLEAWVEVALTMLSVCRDAGDTTAFQAWRTALASITARRSEWAAQFGYQVALMHLDQQEIQLASEIANNQDKVWPHTLNTFPLGEVWRSAVLAEIGDLDAAEVAVENALRYLNETLARMPSLTVRSQEGWARASLKAIRRAKTIFGIEKQEREDDLPIWDETEPSLGGDPYVRLNEVKARVERPFPEVKDEPASSFDPGRYTLSYSSSGRHPFEEHKHGVAYFRLREVGGVPLRAGGFALDSPKVVRAAAWARPFVPWTSYAMLLRSAAKEATEVFTRPRVAGFDTEQVEALADVALKGAEAAASALVSGNEKAAGRLAGLLGVLSCLAIRRSDLALRVLDFAITIGQHAKKWNDRTWYKSLGDVVGRTASAIRDDELATRVPRLFALPLTGRDLPTGGMIGPWFEPSEVIRRVSLDAEVVGRGLVAGLIEVLAGQGPVPEGADAAKDRPVAQDRAAKRLAYLYKAGGLTTDESNHFAEVYWGLASEEEIPEIFSLGVHFALLVPQPPSGSSVEDRVGQALLRQDWGSNLGMVGLPGVAGAFIAPLRAATTSPLSDTDELGVDWTPEEASLIVQRLAAYWDAAGDRYLHEREREGEQGMLINLAGDLLQEQLTIIPLALADVALTRLSEDDKMHQQTAERILGEMADAGFPVAVAYPALIRFGFDPEKARQQIRKELAST